MALPGEKAKSARKRLAALLFIAALPVTASYLLMLNFAVNIPYIDDYPNFLGFSLQWKHLPSIQEKAFYFLTVQHDEYKFVFMHVIALLEMSLTDNLDMRVLSIVGDLFLLALLALLWKMYVPRDSNVESKVLFFLPVIFLVFGLNYAEGVLWPSSTLFYVPAIVFSFLAIHLLVGIHDACDWARFGWACCAALLAYFTAPNSGALFPIGIVLLLLRRDLGKAFVWCVTFLCGLTPYLVSYQTKNTQVVALGHASIGNYLAYFVNFVGSIGLKSPAPMAIGLAILAIIVFAMRTGFARSHLAATLGTIWILAGAVLVAYGRAHAGISFALTPRYRIYSDVLTVYCYGATMNWLGRSPLPATRRNLLRYAILGATSLYCAVNDIHAVTILKGHRKQLLTGLSQYRRSGGQASPMYFPDEPTSRQFARQEVEARRLLEEANAEGLYVPPAETLRQIEP